MIIEIPNENSIIKWKNDDKDEWKVAEISDLIKAYEMPKGDLISREALKEDLELSKYIIPSDLNRLLNAEINRCIEAIDNAPTVESEITEKQAITKIINSGWIIKHDKELRDRWERPQGEWLEMKRKIDNRHYVFIFKCPFCGYIEKCKANFCGKCGAEMKMRTTAD